MSIKMPRRTREDMLREWDEDYSQEDREGVAYQLLKAENLLTTMFYEVAHQGWAAQAAEFERAMRVFKLAKGILAFDPDKEDP